MTDSALSSLYPIHQIGSDGFNWWIGQVETDPSDDPKGSHRVKVRIVGYHPQSCKKVENDSLPWAITVMPATNPYTPGGCNSVSPQIVSGNWVLGFFLDVEKQQPVIMGCLPMVANSTKEELPAEDPSLECRSFTTFLHESTLPGDQPASTNKVPLDTVKAGNVNDGKARRNSDEEITSQEVVSQVNQRGTHSESNPAGREVCVEKADKCGHEQDLNGTFTRLIGEMLHETQRNNGKLGTYLVNSMSGGLYDAIDVGRDYVDRATLVIRTFIAKVKGFVLAKIKAAVKILTNSLLRPSKDSNVLTPVTKYINDMLSKVGCEMADLGDRLIAWIEKVILGYLMNLYKSTACQVDKFVQGLLNKIQSLMQKLLEDVLGPLQDILGAIAAPLNIIGDAINYVLDLLGIQCNGPNSDCAATTSICSDNKTSKKKDFLDRLLEDLNEWPDGADWTQYTCKDSYEGTNLDPTDIVFVGGIQNPPKVRGVQYRIDDIVVFEGEEAVFTITRSGRTDISSSVSFKTKSGTATQGEDFKEESGIIGFSPKQTKKTITVRTFTDTVGEGYEDFYVRIFKDTPGEGSKYPTIFHKNIAKCVIKEGSISPGSPGFEDDTPIAANPDFPSSDPTTDGTFDDEVGHIITDNTPAEITVPSFVVTSDKASVKEGEFVTFTITGKNVNSGTLLSYQLFGSGITPSDIVGNSLQGNFTMERTSTVNETDAKVVVGIRKDSSIEDEETLLFTIPGTGATASVLIVSDLAGLSDEQIAELEDEGVGDLDDGSGFATIPKTGTPITGPDGGIMDIPIVTTGDPYDEPPSVFITGLGYGATGRVLLDTDGYATEIRIVTPGFGYKLNTPISAKKECIIDSFTMVTPGVGYTTAPTVWINGRNDVAEALINSDGQVISVRIKDRTVIFDEYPEVKILGGGGYAAKFIPSFACLDPDARVKIGSAKVGTGSYIDCP